MKTNGGGSNGSRNSDGGGPEGGQSSAPRPLLSRRRLAELELPWAVDVHVPAASVGKTVADMDAWYLRLGGPGRLYVRLMTQPASQPEGQVLLRFYFATDVDAMAFAAAWGGTMAASAEGLSRPH